MIKTWQTALLQGYTSVIIIIDELVVSTNTA